MTPSRNFRFVLFSFSILQTRVIKLWQQKETELKLSLKGHSQLVHMRNR